VRGSRYISMFRGPERARIAAYFYVQERPDHVRIGTYFYVQERSERARTLTCLYFQESWNSRGSLHVSMVQRLGTHEDNLPMSLSSRNRSGIHEDLDRSLGPGGLEPTRF